MVTTQKLSDVSRDAGGFYVPQFRLVAEEENKPKSEHPLPASVLRDVVEITYKDKLEEIDSCEIVVNNWDAEHNCFKYIGSETLDSKGKPTVTDACSPYWNIFDPCNRVINLSFGYAPGELKSMMRGSFVTYEPSFSQSGPPTLSVRMLNLLQKLRTKKYDKEYTAKLISKLTDTAIANWISTQSDSDHKDQKRFPIPIKPYEAKSGDIPEPTLTYVIQKSQYDIDFLWQRARMNGYELRIDKAPDGSDQLIYQPSGAPKPPVYELKWGQSLLDFKPTLTVGNQYKSVTVRYFDRATQKTVDVKLDYTDPKVKVNPNLHYLLDQCDPREETIIEKPFYSKAEAERYCASVFTDQLKRMVKATGTTIGLPGLRAGCKIKIGGTGKNNLGSRLSGIYFVTATTHTFNSNGYTTKFEARREDDEEGKK